MIKYKKGYKYQLCRSYTLDGVQVGQKSIKTPYIVLTQTGKLTIRSGYAWDGASGIAPDLKTNMRGSLIHDVLCQLIRQGYLKKSVYDKTCDIFIKVCREDGMGRIMAKLHSIGVRTGIAKRIATGKPKKVYTAP